MTQQTSQPIPERQNPGHQIILVGDSHVVAFETTAMTVADGAGLKETVTLVTQYVAPGRRVRPLMLTDADGVPRPNPLIAEPIYRAIDTIRRTDPADLKPVTIVLCLTGAEAAREAARPLWREVDFLLPGEAPEIVIPGRSFLPLGVVRSVMADVLSEVPAFLTAAAKLGPVSLAVLSPPPPHRRTPGDDGVPNPTRRKLLRVHVDVLSEMARASGVQMFDTWPFSTDAEGYLKPAFEQDGYHGNEAYARTVSGWLAGSVVSRKPLAVSDRRGVRAGS